MISEINKNFVIRYFYYDSKQSYLIGAGQYWKLVGVSLANRHFNKVLNGGLDKYTFKLRRGLQINFLSK